MTNLLTDNNSYKKAFIGYGKKMEPKTSKEDEMTPGPIYKTDEINSIDNLVKKRIGPRDLSFGNNYDAYDKNFFRGADNHFYGREGKGPGAYANNFDSIGGLTSSKSKSAMKYSMPKVRNLLMN